MSGKEHSFSHMRKGKPAPGYLPGSGHPFPGPQWWRPNPKEQSPPGEADHGIDFNNCISVLSGSRPAHNIPEGSPLNPQHLHWGLECPHSLLVVQKSPCFYHVHSEACLLLSLNWWLRLQCHCIPFPESWSHPRLRSLGGRAYICAVYMYTGTHSWSAGRVSHPCL